MYPPPGTHWTEEDYEGGHRAAKSFGKGRSQEHTAYNAMDEDPIEDIEGGEEDDDEGEYENTPTAHFAAEMGVDEMEVKDIETDVAASYPL